MRWAIDILTSSIVRANFLEFDKFIGAPSQSKSVKQTNNKYCRERKRKKYAITTVVGSDWFIYWLFFEG
jgi:hypothetical protein